VGESLSATRHTACSKLYVDGLEKCHIHFLTPSVCLMCGFCGFAYSDTLRPVEVERLRAMHSVIAHRGPDGMGEHMAGAVALGHRRLSIIDVEGGRQPLSNEDGTVWIVFNGEIYNFGDLTDRLRRLGHCFRTRSDTEAIVHAYEEYGLDFVRHLNGMFSLAIHDRRRGRVVLARDHFGIKPLFYSVSTEGLFFGSEIKAVLRGSARKASPNATALQEYLIFRYSAGSRTFFDGVSRLPAAHFAVWERGVLSIQRYWSPPRPRTEPITEAEVQSQFAEKFDTAVASQLISEVPLGSFCSGGIDSGLVTAHAVQHSAERFQTFSVGFEEAEWDESSLASDTAQRYGTDHHSVIMRAADLLRIVPKLLWYNDEPLSHPNSVPLYLLSELARQHVTVVLTGEGADELFCGYPRYRIASLRAALANVPTAARRLVAGFARASGDRRAALVGRLLPLSSELSVVMNSAYVEPSLVARLTSHDTEDALSERLALAQRSWVTGDPLATISAYEMQTYLQCALERMDRMSMAHGLEGRVPFLDVSLAEWGQGVPSNFKVHGRTGKALVKRHARNRLSARVINGRKSGFGLPLDDWFRNPSSTHLLATLRDPQHPATAVLDAAVVGSLVNEHLLGQTSHGEVLWLLTNVFLWYEHVAAAYP
jgi:asparagine synthase (glutamine-hydrolysing)